MFSLTALRTLNGIEPADLLKLHPLDNADPALRTVEVECADVILRAHASDPAFRSELLFAATRGRGSAVTRLMNYDTFIAVWDAADDTERQLLTKAGGGIQHSSTALAIIRRTLLEAAIDRTWSQARQDLYDWMWELAADSSIDSLTDDKMCQWEDALNIITGDERPTRRTLPAHADRTPLAPRGLAGIDAGTAINWRWVRGLVSHDLITHLEERDVTAPIEWVVWVDAHYDIAPEWRRRLWRLASMHGIVAAATRNPADTGALVADSADRWWVASAVHSLAERRNIDIFTHLPVEAVRDHNVVFDVTMLDELCGHDREQIDGVEALWDTWQGTVSELIDTARRLALRS